MLKRSVLSIIMLRFIHELLCRRHVLRFTQSIILPTVCTNAVIYVQICNPNGGFYALNHLILFALMLACEITIEYSYKVTFSDVRPLI